jgi:4a-hydroxytetrahydrobiopterin dehydratase
VADELLDDDQLAEALATLPGWTMRDGGLHRELSFADFGEAFGFMTRVALAAERLDHHPDWSNSWNRVVVDIISHAKGGLTTRCVALARAVDEVLAGVQPEPG